MLVLRVDNWFDGQLRTDAGGRLSLKLIPKSGNGVCRINVEKAG